MEKFQNSTVMIQCVMAVCGGFLGAYALFSRQLVFGSSQTANVIELVSAVCGRNLPEFLIHLGALLIYIAAIVLATAMGERTSFDIRYLSLGINAAVIFACAFIPLDMDPVMALYPIFFATAFQWCSFKGVGPYASSTIFSTNNIKQTFSSLTKYFLEKDPEARKPHAEKARIFGGTLLCFNAAAAAEYLLLQVFSLYSIWFALIPLCLCLFFLSAERRGAGAFQPSARETLSPRQKAGIRLELPKSRLS